jgi:hypothetical protein
LDYFPAGSWPIVGVVSNCASPNALYFVHRPLTGSPARKSESPFQSQPSCFAAPRPSDTITRSLTKHFTSPLCCTTTLGLLSTTFFYLSSSITACKFDGIASVATLILPSPCPGNDTSSFAAVLRHPSPTITPDSISRPIYFTSTSLVPTRRCRRSNRRLPLFLARFICTTTHRNKSWCLY